VTTLDVSLAGSDGTVTSSQSAAFSVADSGYSTGKAWATADDFKVKGSYIQGRSYTFSAPTLLKVTDDDDSLYHPSWWSAKTRITLAVPGGFQLDVAASPGWSQSSDDTISFDPTVSGAVLSFSGSFTSAPGDYTAADGASTISGYFGSSDELKTLALATPISVTVLDPATAAVKPALTVTKGSDDTAYIATDSSPARPGMKNTYDVTYGAAVPVSSAEDYKDVSLDVAPADGSYFSAGTLTVSNPSAGAVVSVTLTSQTGATKTVSYTVTDANVTAKKATVSLPADEGSGWVGVTAGITKLVIGSAMTVDFPKTAAQSTLNDGSDIADKTVKASSATASGTAATSGSYGATTYTSDTTADSKTVGEKVTYRKTALVNSDLSLEIGVWRSSYHANSGFVKKFEYGSKGSNLYPANGGANAAGNTTTTKVYEPVVYEMLPRKTVYTGYTVRSGVPAPTVTSYQVSGGRTVVKLDWTGTQWWLDTETDANYGSEFMDVNWKPDAVGVTTTSSAAIWISNANDPDLTIKNYNSYGGNAIDQPIDADLAAEATQNDSGAALIGTYSVTLVPSASYSSFTGDVTVTDNRGVSSKAGANVLTSTTTADHTLQTTITNPSNTDTSNVSQLINLPTNLSLTLTGAVTLINTDGTTVTDTNVASVMYSMGDLTLPDDSSGLTDTTWLTAEAVPFLGGWGKVRSLLVTVPTSATQSEYQVSIPVTDSNASNETKTWGTITASTYADDSPKITATAKDSYSLMTGVKNWDDGNDMAATRPTSLDVNLKSGGKTVETVTTTQWKAWEYDFSASPVDASGNFIDFTVEEATVPDNYKESVDGFNITNTYTGFLSSLPFTGGTGNSFAALALVFAAVSFAAAVGALVVQKRRAA
jgi:hypothetical protein